MFRTIFASVALLFLLRPPHTFCQEEERPIKIFSYFQNSLQHWGEVVNQPEHNSFSIQQLNLFFQKDLALRWRAFVNFEFLNNFSSSRQWGTANLSEAWVSYRGSQSFNLKLGLQIPIFNNFNEIKNRTPLLPHIIRPIVYETSFQEFFNINEFVPSQAYVQVYGFLPGGKAKIDYAAYVGNSDNINNDRTRGQTGVDTSTTVLVGGRLGLRYQDLKIGLSATYERKNNFRGLAAEYGLPLSKLTSLPKTRFGGDLSYAWRGFTFQGEFISVDVNDDLPELDLDLDFYYGDLGYYFTDELFVYGGLWWTRSRYSLTVPGGNVEEEDVVVANIGCAYDATDRIRFKVAYAQVDDEYEDTQIGAAFAPTMIFVDESFYVLALAVSIIL